MIRDELDRYLELETLRFRCALVQARIASGLTRDDLERALGRRGGEWLDQMEDVTSDVTMSSIRRYCAAVGIVIETRVEAIPEASGAGAPPESDAESWAKPGEASVPVDPDGMVTGL